MDYDDTDFQSQKVQLAGEDNSKFSSGLRPFALPKLDIDDQLQGNLRFDNLVDSEGFFSVEAHDNSWIEVLSTGSSVVDFSSSAAESCSISRTNYVWSEATSTECVEMLLKSVGENEMIGNMDSNVHRQLNGMESQTDPSNTRARSSNSPTGNIVVSSENLHSQSACSRMAEDPSRSRPQLEHIVPFSIDGKAEYAAGSTLSDMKSNYMSVSENHIVSNKLSSASKNKPESCPAVGNYFQVVHDRDSLDNLNIHSDGIDSRKLNNEPFSELAPIQNIYVSDSYHFQQDNKKSGDGVSPQDSETRHLNETNFEGGLHELQNLRCPSQHMATVNLSDEVNNETLLSDGLLEAITNPVKILHRNDDTCNGGASATLQPCFSQVKHAVEGLKGSMDRCSEPVIKKFSIEDEPNSVRLHQSEPDLRNSSPHLVTPLSTESGESVHSPNGKQFAHVTVVPVDARTDGVDDTSINDKKVEVEEQHQESVDNIKNALDAHINTGDDSKLVVLKQHQDSIDNLTSVVMKDRTIMEEISDTPGNTEHMMETAHDVNASAACTSKHKFDLSSTVEPDNFAAGSLDENDPNISSINTKGLFQEDNVPALGDEHGSQHLASPNSGTQEKKSALSNISSSNTVSATDADISISSIDKLDCSGGAASDDSPAVILDGNYVRISSINHEESFKEGSHFSSEVGGHNVTTPVSEPWGKNSGIVINSNTNAVCSSGTDVISEKTQCSEQASSLSSLTMNQSQDNSGDHPYAHKQKCRTDGPSVQPDYHKIIHPHKCQIGEPSIQSEHNENIAAPSPSLGASPDKTSEKIIETPFSAKDDPLTCIQDHTPGTVSSQSRVILEPGNDDDISNDAACGSPTVISCTEPCPQEVGLGGSALLHRTLDEQSEDPKDLAGPVDTSQKNPGECSARNIKPILSSEEINTVGDDKSFSFKVGDPPKVYEKACSPAWNPFPISTAAQSIGASTEIPKPGSPRNPLKNTSDDSKKITVLETGREQLSGTKVAESAGELSISSHIGDNTKAKSAPLEQPQQHPIPESSALVHQPFTDVQHVQLRAQIFVYGALIQGIPPADAYMMSAFGASVGDGKPGWEAVWRAAVERFQNQKSPLTGLETPTSSRIGNSAAEKASNSTVAKTAPISKKGGKTVLPTHPSLPHNSPTFSVSPLGSSTLNLQRGGHLDFTQTVSPVFTHSSQMRTPTSTVASWFPSSPGQRAAPWLVPPQNLIFDSSMQPAVTASEITKGGSSKNISISQPISPGAFLPSPVSSTVCSPLVIVHEEKLKVPASTSKRGTPSQKPRKRKKASTSPEQQSAIASPQFKTDITSATTTKHTPAFTLSSPSPINVLGSGLVSDTSLITSVPNYLGGIDADQRIIFSEQICGAVEQSMEQAKGASVHSAEALKHNEDVWSQLSAISRGKLPAEVEQKLTSAAAAVSAAGSVAKAAAEAAKMAAAAALQAKMMAEEALGSSNSANSLQKYDAGVVDANSNLGCMLSSLTPKASWKIRDITHAPGSTISVAREVARKRVEEASAAAKRAQNLDAILKAAELAAEAVFNAGNIIGMGEPLPFTLSELLEAGPDGYWKADQIKNKNAWNPSANVVTEKMEVSTDSTKSGRKCGIKAKYDQATQISELSSRAKEMQPDGVHSGNGLEDIPTVDPLSSNKNDTVPTLPSIVWNEIGKGSLVEVLADKGGSRAAWFSAKVHDINEDSACISYEFSTEGNGLHKEWVTLKQMGDKAPQIRVAHPATVSKFNGTRKRRRDTSGNHSWATGDHVDAWIKDSWREGIISQSCEFGKLAVQFSVGDSVVVDACNLRPSLVWKDGQWTEWSRAQERKDKSNKGDSPYEKRQRTAVSDHVPFAGEAGEPSKDKSSNNVTKPEELKPLALSDRDVIFNIGKSAAENKTTRRPGLQKEGSKVYGVPKPGKKKKFMEVSKRYDPGQADKISKGTASTRFAKPVMSQVPRPRESTSKKLDQRGKRVGDMRSRALNSMKAQNVSTNSLPGKDPLSMPVPSSSVLESSLAIARSTAGSSNTVNPTVEKNISAHGTDLRTEVAFASELQVQAAPTVLTGKKNLTTTDRAKRKYVPSVDNNLNRMLKTSEVPGQTSSDSAEPRRSNRRIQPTSRLLEGLQSSLIISKVAGEKGPRTNYRSATSTSRGRAQG